MKLYHVQYNIRFKHSSRIHTSIISKPASLNKAIKKVEKLPLNTSHPNNYNKYINNVRSIPAQR